MLVLATSETGIKGATMANQPTVIRSMVYVSAHDADHILETAQAGMDALCLDMEDLTPRANKDDARRIFPEVAKQLDAMGIRVMARTNGLEGGMAKADLDAIVSTELHCVNVPKTESPDEIVEFCALLDEVEADKGVPAGHTLVRPVIETALGVKYAYEIATASPRIAYMGGVQGIWWGDLGSSLGYLSTATGLETLFVRSKVLVDVRAAGVAHPIGGGSLITTDSDAIRAFYTECKVLGYTGVHCTGGANSVQLANEVFVPSAEELELWLSLLPSFEEAERQGQTAVWVNGKHFDLVCLPRIRSQMELARRLDLVPRQATFASLET
jgi:citrate lyase subunit beta/citryl-CoA lyase